VHAKERQPLCGTVPLISPIRQPLAIPNISKEDITQTLVKVVDNFKSSHSLARRGLALEGSSTENK